MPRSNMSRKHCSFSILQTIFFDKVLCICYTKMYEITAFYSAIFRETLAVDKENRKSRKTEKIDEVDSFG